MILKNIDELKCFKMFHADFSDILHNKHLLDHCHFSNSFNFTNDKNQYLSLAFLDDGLGGLQKE